MVQKSKESFSKII